MNVMAHSPQLALFATLTTSCLTLHVWMFVLRVTMEMFLPKHARVVHIRAKLVPLQLYALVVSQDIG